MPPADDTQEAALARCAAEKARGNAAFAAGDLSLAADRYVEALSSWEAAIQSGTQSQALGVGQRVRYGGSVPLSKGGQERFGMVMSAFPLFDEYFLKDLGTDSAIWAGEEGGKLKPYSRQDLRPVTPEMLEVRAAVLQNLSAVRLKEDRFQEAVRFADGALCIDGRTTKALMRKGAALLRLNQPGPASDVLASCLERVPNDREVRRLLREAEQRRSPTWVCVTGCCGPWGIVCGGPKAQNVAEVVAPARKPLDNSLEVEDPGDPELEAPTTAADENGDSCSSCSSSEPPSPRLQQDERPKIAPTFKQAAFVAGAAATEKPRAAEPAQAGEEPEEPGGRQNEEGAAAAQALPRACVAATAVAALAVAVAAAYAALSLEDDGGGR